MQDVSGGSDVGKVPETPQQKSPTQQPSMAEDATVAVAAGHTDKTDDEAIAAHAADHRAAFSC
eukprot:12934788-Prorocentrum_lima.AAC.1